MSLVLRVDGERWRAHLRGIADAHPGLVPVVKGNGYGFGLGRLARRAQWLGADTLAVGLYAELPHVASRFAGDLLVMSPWRPGDAVPDDDRVIHTVGRLEDLAALADAGTRPRVVLERLTSMLRHGFAADGLGAAVRMAGQGKVRLEGVAMHLPLGRQSHVPEVGRLMGDVLAAGVPHDTVWVSHLDDAELTTLQQQFPDHRFRPRIGTRLWLGAGDALSVKASVLDVHPVRRGDVYGYRCRAAPRNGTILVVSGGTSHGVGLEAPTGASGLRSRAIALANGSMDAAGFVRSPYTVAGKHRLFAEPPHMQASMLFVPAGVRVPAVGDEIDCRVRFTTATFDGVEYD